MIGGVAVAAHGYVRGTGDLDLVPDPDPENLKRVTEVLNELEATLPTAEGRRFDPSSDAGVVRRGGNVTADTGFGGLDVVQRARGRPGEPAREPGLEDVLSGYRQRIAGAVDPLASADRIARLVRESR